MHSLPAPAGETADQALVDLGRTLFADGYRFVTPTPETHRRVVERRPPGPARDLREAFGWSLPFADDLVPPGLRARLGAAGMLERLPSGLLASAVRFSTLGERLYCHSAWPTTAADAVFFGPDTYRFARFVRASAPAAPGVVVDVGAGSGAGGIELAARARKVLLADINPRALRLARANALINGCAPGQVVAVHSDLLNAVPGPIDLLIANPPYLVDPAERTYRHGGGELGIDLAVRIVRDGLLRLSPGGSLLLYTGAPVVAGVDILRRALEPLLARARVRYDYHEIDPDVFGEELDQPAYHQVERIAVVGLQVRT